MKGAKIMKDLGNIINITLTKDEYQYLKNLSVSMYKTLEKLPKKMRTPKFYILENMIKYTFSE